jgi:hypothetical protein
MPPSYEPGEQEQAPVRLFTRLALAPGYAYVSYG